MPGTKFILDADAAKAVQEFLRVRSAEKQVEDGLRGVVSSAKSAGDAMSASARQGVREYELASSAIKRSAAIQPGLNDHYRPRGVVPYEVAAIASTTLRASAPTIAAAKNDGFGYNLARTDDEKFSRFMQAEAIRSTRRATRSDDQAFADFLKSEAQQTRRYNATSPRADASMAKMDGLLNQHRPALLDSANLQVERAALDQQLALIKLETNQAVQRQRADFYVSQAKWSVGTLVAGIGILDSLTEKYAQTLAQAGAAGSRFEADMRPLLSLGDNAKHGGLVRDQVLAQSNAYGLDVNQVASAQFMLQSAASNLGAKTQKEIFSAGIGLNQVAGGDLQAEYTAITKVMQTYGREMGTAEMAAAKLLAIEDKSAITISELSELLPDVLPAAKLMGQGLDEIGASVITATDILGKNDKTLTALRNTYLKMGKAVEEGLVPQGKFVDQLIALSNVPPVDLERIFGERTVTLIAALSSSVATYTANLKAMQAVASNDVIQKWLTLNTAPTRRAADTMDRLKTMHDNADLGKFKDPDAQDMAERMAFAQVGFDKWKVMHPTKNAVLPESAIRMLIAQEAVTSAQIAEADARHDGSGDELRSGLASSPVGKPLGMIRDAVLEDLSNLRLAGDPTSRIKANVEQLRHGSELDEYIFSKGPDGKTRKNYSGAYEAQQYSNLSNQFGAPVDMRAYENYRGAEISGDTAGMKAALAEITRLAKAAADKAAHDVEVARKGAEAIDRTNAAASETLKAATALGAAAERLFTAAKSRGFHRGE